MNNAEINLKQRKIHQIGKTKQPFGEGGEKKVRRNEKESC